MSAAPDCDPLHCGCCGNEIGRSTRSDPDWCKRCAPHVNRHTPEPPWMRTYQVLHGEPCPYQVGAVAQPQDNPESGDKR